VRCEHDTYHPHHHNRLVELGCFATGLLKGDNIMTLNDGVAPKQPRPQCTDLPWRWETQETTSGVDLRKLSVPTVAPSRGFTQKIATTKQATSLISDCCAKIRQSLFLSLSRTNLLITTACGGCQLSVPSYTHATTSTRASPDLDFWKRDVTRFLEILRV